MQLSRSVLVNLGEKVDKPKRDSAGRRVGIVHLGPGAFHRAHQAPATEICLEAGQVGWAICCISLRSNTFSEYLTERHGHPIQAIPIGRLKGLAELRGAIVAIDKMGLVT